MSYTSFGSSDAETNKRWSKVLAVAERVTLNIAPLMGSGMDSIIQVKDELEKGAGDRVTFTLRTRLAQKGIGAAQTAEGNGEALSTYTDAILIDELLCNVATKSQYSIDAQRVPFNLRDECKDAAAEWWRERKCQSFLNHVCGFTPINTSGATSGLEYAGWNTVVAPAGASGLVRQIWAGAATTDEGLSNSDTFSRSLIDRAVEAAGIGNRMIRPVMVGGQQKYVLYIHPRQERQLRNDSGTGGWQDITKFSYSGIDASKNPLYNGALGEWNGCILRKSQDVTNGVHSSTGAAETDVYRGVLLGAQAAVTAFGRKGFGPSKYRWNEELIDHGRKLEVSAMSIYGIKKAQFNSVDHGTLVVSTHNGE